MAKSKEHYEKEFDALLDAGDFSPTKIAEFVVKEIAAAELAVRAEETRKRVAPTNTILPANGPLFTAEDWANHSEYRMAWAQTWELPHMKAGLQVLFLAGTMTQSLPAPSGVDFIQAQANRQAQHEGYFNALRSIEALKRAAPEKPTARTSGWGDQPRQPTNQ